MKKIKKYLYLIRLFLVINFIKVNKIYIAKKLSGKYQMKIARKLLKNNEVELCKKLLYNNEIDFLNYLLETKEEELLNKFALLSNFDLKSTQNIRLLETNRINENINLQHKKAMGGGAESK